jgi:beta-lactamase regulating signal transducer with metallopeptidase domain
MLAPTQSLTPQFWILEAAFRSLLMGVAVWAGIRALRVQAVVAQKVAWVLVLLAAVTMPLVMRAPWPALNTALRIPVSAPHEHAQKPVAPAALQFAASSSSSAIILDEPASSLTANPPSRNLLKLHSGSYAVHEVARSVHHSSKATLRVKHDTSKSALLSAPNAQPLVAASPVLQFSSPSAPQAVSPAHFWTWARLAQALTILYLSVAGLLLLRTLAGLSIAFRIWRRSRPVILPAVTLLSASEIHRVRSSPDLATPVTIGSTVILPADYSEWDEAKLRIVLAHEQSHVRQRDFYLQLFAALHLAVFWFSPLGWWLQRKLSELGEALSDRAGLAQAPNPASYAQILLEFAARPRTNTFSRPLAGVAMAPTSNLSSRIERILNASLFRLAFRSSRSSAFLSALLVPAALIVAVACIRFVPAVDAAQAPVTTATASPSVVVGPIPPTGNVPVVLISPNVPMALSTSVQSAGQISPAVADQVTTVDSQDAAPTPPSPAPSPAVAPTPTPAPAPDVEPMPAPQAVPVPEISADVAPVAPVPPVPPRHPRGRTYVYSDDDDDRDSFAIVHGDNSNVVMMNGHSSEELKKVREKYHGDYIWIEHNGKSYVITDPAILAQTQSYFKGDEALNSRMKVLETQQAELDKRMALLQPEMEKASLPGPEFEEQMAKLRKQLAYLQSDEYKKLTEQLSKQLADSKKVMDEAALQLTQEKLGNLQEKIGDIQGQIGEIQGKIGERQGLIGEKQGQLGEQMGRLGEQMGRIGEEQGRHAEEAARRMRSVFDQAIKDGRAKPVE